ncbi:hypothetical protein P2H44_03360 [Albimonas sp. CAU 1670]|uniref:hypothetical protein n=1 Tax=Albimonas sp. CAU 1670 TaxID=3032599 RepID=UPI0023D9B67B|nr:hypothetical protein [Albimonas sp. CAU 1670]MDF2231582.1 hypothetical protein [Albimonas sp. CAU 1670]
MPETEQSLAARAKVLDDEVARLDGEIAERVADGEGQSEQVAEMRAKRRRLLGEHSDLGEALAVLRRRRADEAEKAQEQNRQEALVRMHAQVDEFLDASSAIDEALEALEDAHNRLHLASLDLSRSARMAGESDGGRLSNAIGPAMRWAAWHSAPGASKDMQVPRATGARQRPLRKSLENVIPTVAKR